MQRADGNPVFAHREPWAQPAGYKCKRRSRRHRDAVAGSGDTQDRVGDGEQQRDAQAVSEPSCVEENEATSLVGERAVIVGVHPGL
jgi:hypothetical protein